MDRISKEQRRINMQAVKSSGSVIETTLAKSLFHRGYRFRKNDSSVYGKPDLSFKKKKIAIFVDSEFWHGKDWPNGKKEFKSNKEFWIAKIERNILRDREVNRLLDQEGWTVLRFWGKQIKLDLDYCIEQIERVYKSKI